MWPNYIDLLTADDCHLHEICAFKQIHNLKEISIFQAELRSTCVQKYFYIFFR